MRSCKEIVLFAYALVLYELKLNEPQLCWFRRNLNFSLKEWNKRNLQGKKK